MNLRYRPLRASGSTADLRGRVVSVVSFAPLVGRPQRNIQSVFESGDGVGFGPRVAEEDVADDAVRNPGSGGNLTQALPRDGVPQSHHDEAQRLDRGLSAVSSGQPGLSALGDLRGLLPMSTTVGPDAGRTASGLVASTSGPDTFLFAALARLCVALRWRTTSGKPSHPGATSTICSFSTYTGACAATGVRGVL